MLSEKDNEIYEFGEFRLNVAERFLFRLDGGERVSLSEKAFETLCVLVRNGGHLVSKDELLNQVWAESFVEENNLNKCVHAIRRALGETSEQQFIETVKKHGFRFVAEVRCIAGDAENNKNPVLPNIVASPRFSLSASPTGKVVALAALAAFLIGTITLGYYFFVARNTIVGDKKSIAVLPLKPINTTNRDEIYEIGIADSLILRLSSMAGFIVRPLSATRKYADIEQDAITAGKEQQVDYVLASNYQLAGGKIRITSQLFNVANGQIEETYKIEKEAGDVFAMQDAVAGEVGNKLLARFATTESSPTAKRGTTNEEAYRLYWQGRNLIYKRTAADSRKAVEYFEQAIRLDPNFAQAYSGMAHAYIASGNFGGGLPREEYAKAKGAVTKALELDNNLAEGYTVSGELKVLYEWDFAGAEKDLLRGIELDPNSDLAHEQYAAYLANRGRFNEALAEVKTALETDPNSLQNTLAFGRILYLARRYDEAIIQLRQVIEVNKDAWAAYGWLWTTYEMKHENDGAYEWFIKLLKRTNPERIAPFQQAYETAGWQGVRLKNLEFLKQDEGKPAGNYYRLARQCVLIGDKEQAFEYLNKAIEKRHGQMVMLNVEPSFDSLHDDPRFDELVRRIGLK